MKICPYCNNTYSDDSLFFCLNDGEQLSVYNSQQNPTSYAEPSRITNENWNQYQQNTNWQNQQIAPNQQFNQFLPAIGLNQTIPIISMILGIISILLCCYGGIPFGFAAMILGYIGMNNADSNPTQYGGKGMAIAGLATGIISFAATVIFIILLIFAK
jgi:Domain of unknown function (DUF4190)